MIILDTHVWVWWVSQDRRLTEAYRAALAQHQPEGLGVSAISCWEIAKLVEVGRLRLSIPVLSWVEQALSQPGVRLLDLTPRIAVASAELPAPFHRDPADQILVATARVFDAPLLTADEKLQQYPHVRTLPI